MKIAKISTTPITEETFRRQKWLRHIPDDDKFLKYDAPFDSEKEYFFVLPVPKHRKEKSSMFLVSNSSMDEHAVISMGLNRGEYFVEIMGMDGQGFCTCEEDLEILYRALTGDWIET